MPRPNDAAPGARLAFSSVIQGGREKLSYTVVVIGFLRDEMSVLLRFSRMLRTQ